MPQRLASLGIALVAVALATSGCFAQPGDGVFGPANSLGGAENGSPALSLKASPARGPGPLDVGFSLSALDRDGGSLTWSLDFGDRTAPAAGSDLPSAPRHTYKAPGAYLATFKVISDGETFVSTISIVVLEGIVPGNATQGPAEPPEYSPPRSGGGGGGGGGGSSSSQSESSPSTGPGNTTASETGTSTGPPSNGTSSTSGSSTSATTAPTSSETSSGSDTGTSSSSTGTETFSDPGTSTSSTSTAPPPDPEPTGSESQSSTDPPL